MRRAAHEGQTPRPLQKKATKKSCPQSSLRARAKPWAKMPHSRSFLNTWRRKKKTPDSFPSGAFAL
jgi:hypothetical protein